MSEVAPPKLNQFIKTVRPTGRKGGESRLATHWDEIKELRSRAYSWGQVAEYINAKAGFRPKDGELSLYHSRQLKRGK